MTNGVQGRIRTEQLQIANHYTAGVKIQKKIISNFQPEVHVNKIIQSYFVKNVNAT